MQSFFGNILEEKFLHDNREIEYEVSIPGIGNFGLALPLLSFWIRLSMYLALVSVINLTLGLVIWFMVVKKRGSMSAFLVTFGVVVPLALVLPIQIVSILGIRNAVFIIALAASSTLIVFRCFEALYGTSRAYVDKSLTQFLLYHTSPMPFVIDQKTETVQSATTAGIVSKWIKLLLGLVETTLLLNFLNASDYAPFPRKEIQSIFDFLYWGNLINNFLLAYLVEIYLEFGTRAAAIFISLLTGLETIELNDDPLSRSTSISEFWGRRWNRLVSELLRVGIFKPVLKFGFSKPIAVLATFFASGMLHEYILAVVDNAGVCNYTPKYLNQTAFFLWNGVLLILEGVLVSRKEFRELAATFPRPLKRAMALMTVLPVAHWFLDDYVGIGLFKHFAVAFPLLVKL